MLDVAEDDRLSTAGLSGISLRRGWSTRLIRWVCCGLLAWLTLAIAVTLGGQLIDLVILQPLHRAEYETIETPLTARVWLARVGAALFVPGQAERRAATLTSVCEAHEAAGRVERARTCFLEVLALQQQLHGADDAATAAARSRYLIFLEEHSKAN